MNLAIYPYEAGFKDLDTSREAAVKVPAKQLDKMMLQLIRSYCFGVSPEQIVKEYGLSLLSVRPSFSRLKARGLITDSGRRDKTEQGNNCKIWIAI